MIDKKVELLAPAGNYQALVGALNAGADAVYLGGDKYSARAYADNFTNEEIIKALHYTHVCGKKLYLTLNTLVKEKEFPYIYDYVAPLYEAGLDGVIIQDLGVWSYIKEVFSDLPLHASTQMTITGSMGAALLQQAGASRIVPARELSLQEIKDIKDKTGLEIECFIHGAMCYSYSGQCLFSSILGGRSGNRGRCAQPCRLPYKVGSTDNMTAAKELYPLSLKDMCTIEYIPRLIEAGIDSFKIEGRMKKPEYAAGVTAIYRKYIDRYYEKGAASYHVDEKDMDRLYKLYIRSEVQTGYYERYNGREMVTLNKGNYLGSDENLLRDISEKYLKEEQRLSVSISGTFRAGEAAVLTIEGGGVKQTSYGEVVQQAKKRPMTKEDVLKQLTKTGSFNINIVKENIITGENIFIPVAKLNELRRNAIVEFENKIIAFNGLTYGRKMQLNLQNFHNMAENDLETPNSANEKIYEIPIKSGKSPNSNAKPPQLHITVHNIEQLRTICQYPCDRIYIDSDLYMREYDRISQWLKNRTHFAIFLSLPFIIREKDTAYLERLKSLLDNKIQGFLVRNLEEIHWVLTLGSEFDMVTDSGVYCFNLNALSFWRQYANECCLPWELNAKELAQLIDKNTISNITRLSLPIYGTIPMMISANCVKKTLNSCNYNDVSSIVYLTDRYNTRFPVLCNCGHCYNIIYNSVPYSLHQEWKNIQKLGLFAVRLDFIFENEKQIKDIMDYYTGTGNAAGTKNGFPVTEYTAGHYKRGVE